MAETVRARFGSPTRPIARPPTGARRISGRAISDLGRTAVTATAISTLSVMAVSVLMALSAVGLAMAQRAVDAEPAELAPASAMAPAGPIAGFVGNPSPAQEPEVPQPIIPEIPVPQQPTPGAVGQANDGLISIDIGSGGEGASSSVLLIVGLTVLSLAPSIVMMLTSFTRIIIVFSLTRNALGLQGVPPNQVLVGLALFLSAFVMWPTLTTLNEEALAPYTAGEISQEEAFDRATGPVREFMLIHTNGEELEVMLDASPQARPATIDDVSLSVLIPAFMLSEIKSAFIIGFVIFIPFLIIDIVVAASLMALGMMMLPPAFISLPFKLLLFIMVGGWSLIVETLLATYL